MVSSGIELSEDISSTRPVCQTSDIRSFGDGVVRTADTAGFISATSESLFSARLLLESFPEIVIELTKVMNLCMAKPWTGLNFSGRALKWPNRCHCTRTECAPVQSNIGTWCSGETTLGDETSKFVWECLMDDKLILVVDDDPCCRYALEAVLRRFGFSVISATNGLEGLNLAVARRPKLIFMDLIMPEMDGYSGTRAIHAHPSTASTPVVAVSANSDLKDRLSAREAGMIEFISKPWKVSEIKRMLGELWHTTLSLARTA
jgi:twitching motility two-component system response regulator PilH